MTAPPNIARAVVDGHGKHVPSSYIYGTADAAVYDREADKTVTSVFAAMDDLRDVAILVRDAHDDEAIPGSSTMHTVANQLRRIMCQLGVEAERLDANLDYLVEGDHTNSNH